MKVSESEKVCKCERNANGKKYRKWKSTVYKFKKGCEWQNVCQDEKIQYTNVKKVCEWQKVCEHENVQYANIKKSANGKKYARVKKCSIRM